MKRRIIEAIERKKIIAILRGLSADACVRTAEALYAGGIELVEVTFDQKNVERINETLKAISQICQTMGVQMLVGAGTVTSCEMLELACKAGAAYMISPNTDLEVIRRTVELGCVSIPGALTPSEAVAAHQAGADFVKLFPIDVLGPSYLKAIRAPLNQIRFMAVGGVDQNNIAAYRDAGACGFGIGGCLVKRDWIEAGQYDRITELAREFCSRLRDKGGK